MRSSKNMEKYKRQIEQIPKDSLKLEHIILFKKNHKIYTVTVLGEGL